MKTLSARMSTVTAEAEEAQALSVKALHEKDLQIQELILHPMSKGQDFEGTHYCIIISIFRGD